MKWTIDSINIGVWQWDILNGREWWSKRYYELLGYKDGEIDASSENFYAFIIHPEDREKLENATRNHLKTGEQFRLQVRLKRASGEYGWFLTNGSAVRDSEGKPIFMAGSVVDITEEVNTRQSLERSEAFLEDTGQIARVGGWEVLVTTMKARWTKTVYEIHEVPLGSEISVDKAIDFYHPDDQDRIRRAFERTISEGIPYAGTYRIITANNNLIHVQTVGTPVYDDDGNIIGARGIFQDINEKRRAEILMEETLALSTAQNQKLINFAHIVSHNLRNHTSNLEMLVQFLLESNDEEDKQNLVNKVDQVTQNLAETIGHLNEVLITENAVDKQTEEINVTESVLKTFDILSGDIRNLEASCVVDLPDELYVRFTRAYLDSILLNLISNAIRYRNSEVQLEIKVGFEQDEDYTRVYVQDNGLGIDLTEHKDRMFKMYSTLHNHPDGRGVGLFISKNQMESTGGKITVDSEPMKGSTFTLHFPK